MKEWIVVAGLSQLLLAAASLAIPRVLGWRAEVARLGPLLRAVFWTYSAYVLGTNVAFGLVSALAPSLLLDGSGLARAVSGFISVYWGVRVVLQFAAYSRHAPPGLRFRVAELAMVALFFVLTILYGLVAAGVR